MAEAFANNKISHSRPMPSDSLWK